MALTIHGTTGQDTYVEVLENLRRRGRRRPSRNGLTYALEDVTLALESPLRALPLHCGRSLSLKIAAAEALQLVGGFSDPEWLVRIAPQFKSYLEPNGRFHGAYGERVGDQVEAVVTKLRADQFTRQAVITLWNPRLDNDPDKLDYPCTVALGFSLDGESYRQAHRLNMRVTMRSNDAWLGLPYDLFQFAQLQLTICNIMGYEPGTYTHTAWSMHLYQENADASYQVTDQVTSRDYQACGIGTSGIGFANAKIRARDIAYNDFVGRGVYELSESERWLFDALHA